jgi:hypothetical protein
MMCAALYLLMKYVYWQPKPDVYINMSKVTGQQPTLFVSWCMHAVINTTYHLPGSA